MNDGLLSAHARLSEPFERGRITRLTGPAQRRPFVVVLGMHRSGTSMCAHILSTLGIDLTDTLGANQTNPKGHWERDEIRDFHDRVLALFDRNYFGDFHDFALPVAWWADPRVVQIRREIAGFIEARIGETPFGFKDPRTTRLLPMWHQIIADLNLAPKVILCLRNPVQVARSLRARDNLAPTFGEYRWLVHMLDFFRYMEGLDFCVIEYENWFTDAKGNLDKLKNYLGFERHQPDADIELALADIIDPALRHDDTQLREASQPLVRSVYKLAVRADRDAPASQQLQYITSQFVGFQQLHKPFQQSFETVTRRLTQLGAEFGRLQAERDERDAAAAAAAQRAAEAEQRLTAALADIEAQRDRVSSIERERQAEAAMLEKVREELAAQKTAEVGNGTRIAAEAAQRVAEIERRLSAMTSELETQRGLLGELEQERAGLERQQHETASALRQTQTELVAAQTVLATAQANAAGLADALRERETRLIKLAEHSGERDRLKAELTAADERARHAEQRLAAARAEMQEQRERSAALERARDASDRERSAALERERDASDRERSAAIGQAARRADEYAAALHAAIAEQRHAEAAVEELRSALAEREAGIEALGQRSEETRQALEAAQSREDMLKADLRASEDELRQAEARIFDLLHGLRDREEGLAVQSGRTEQAERRVIEVAEENAAHRERLAHLEAERDQLVADQEQLIAAHERHATALAMVRAELAETLARREAAERQSATLAAVLNERQVELRAAIGRADAQGAALEAANSAIAELCDRNKAAEAWGATLELALGEREAAWAETAAGLSDRLVELAAAESGGAESTRAMRALQAELGRRDARHLQATHEAERRLLQLREAERRLADATATMHRAEEEGAQQREATVSLRAERDRLQQALTKVENTAADRAAESAAMAREMEAVRRALAEAENRVIERASLIAKLEADVAARCNEIAAARDLNKALLASLRADLKPVPIPQRENAWVRTIKALFGIRPAF